MLGSTTYDSIFQADNLLANKPSATQFDFT
jgi:hypothetical protein